MSPLGIEIMLHYYAHADEWAPDRHEAPAVQEMFKALVEGEMLLTGPGLDADGRKYSLAPRGRAYCEALQRVAWPTLAWVFPGDRIVRTP